MSGAKLALLFNLKFSTPLSLERLVNKDVVDVVFNCVSFYMCTFYNQRIPFRRRWGGEMSGGRREQG